MLSAGDGELAGGSPLSLPTGGDVRFLNALGHAGFGMRPDPAVGEKRFQFGGSVDVGTTLDVNTGGTVELEDGTITAASVNVAGGAVTVTSGILGVSAGPLSVSSGGTLFGAKPAFARDVEMKKSTLCTALGRAEKREPDSHRGI